LPERWQGVLAVSWVAPRITLPSVRGSTSENTRHTLENTRQRGCAAGYDGAGSRRSIRMEGVYQLVTDDVIEIAQRSADREHDRRRSASVTPPGSPMSPATALVCWNWAGLGVQDERLPAREIVVEQFPSGWRHRRNASSVFQPQPARRIEVDSSCRS